MSDEGVITTAETRDYLEELGKMDLLQSIQHYAERHGLPSAFDKHLNRLDIRRIERLLALGSVRILYNVYPFKEWELEPKRGRPLTTRQRRKMIRAEPRCSFVEISKSKKHRGFHIVKVDTFVRSAPSLIPIEEILTT